ncbi:MAG: RNA polymerase factor sigma-54 [Rhizobiaceae bacterium]
MALSPKLALRQSQSLVMTPQLMQSIRLLQMTHVELSQFVDEEVERNPLLEIASDPITAIPPERTKETGEAENAGTDFEVASEDWLHTNLDSAETMAANFDAPMDNVFSEEPGTMDALSPDMAAQWKSAQGAGNGTDGSDFEIGDVTAAPVTLRDHVAEQIAFAFPDAVDRLIATELADALDDTGYLRADLEDVSAKLGVPVATTLEVLAQLQTFDPPGLFGRTLGECLAIQLKVKDRFDPAMAILVDNLELLAKRDFHQLKRLCGVDDGDILDMLSEIRALDPKPGTAFQSGMIDAIVPDVSVRPAHDGSWIIELNPAALPRVLLNQSYYATVSKSAQTTQDKEFLNGCLQTANWLTRSLDQRARTILKVAKEIVKQQDGFLVHGVSHLRPSNLKMVADAIKMHESTVSRVTANKFMETPRGVFELRYFFTTALASSEGGEMHSSSSVRHTIRQMIEQEGSKDVLSDDQIVDALVKNGVDIARRTVAKYREAMNIPSSVQRRREKRANAAVTA